MNGESVILTFHGGGKIKNNDLGDVSGSPVVEALPSNAGGAGSTPGWGINMPHASRPKKPLRK